MAEKQFTRGQPASVIPATAVLTGHFKSTREQKQYQFNQTACLTAALVLHTSQINRGSVSTLQKHTCTSVCRPRHWYYRKRSLKDHPLFLTPQKLQQWLLSLGDDVMCALPSEESDWSPLGMYPSKSMTNVIIIVLHGQKEMDWMI